VNGVPVVEPAALAQPVLKVRMDLRVLGETLVLPVLVVLPVMLVPREIRDPPGRRVQQDLLALKDQAVR